MGDNGVSNTVWMSTVGDDYRLGDKLGLRWKHSGKGWSPAQHIIEAEYESDIDQVNRNVQGYVVDRSFLPEAMAVWNRGCFKKVGELFWAAGFMAVRGKLAEVLAHFDLGEGRLEPLAIYKEDMVTPEPGEFFILNFGARKDSIIADQSGKISPMAVDRFTGKQIYSVRTYKEGDIVLGRQALLGPDIWMEERISGAIFMSDAVVRAIAEAEIRIDFRLSQCRLR
jgi:hypothetical protein